MFLKCLARCKLKPGTNVPQIIKSKSSKFIIVALFVYLQIILTEINNEVYVFKLYVVFVVLAFFFFFLQMASGMTGGEIM